MSFNFKTKDDFNSLGPKIKKHVPTFVENRKKDFESLVVAVDQGNFENIRDFCHKQIGVAACYNCFRLEEISLVIQKEAREQNLAAIKNLMPIFTTYIHDLVKESRDL